MGEVDMIYGKCPRCGEDERISSYMASDGSVMYWGVECKSCGFSVKSEKSSEDAFTRWVFAKSEDVLRGCPFCKGHNVSIGENWERHMAPYFVCCSDCGAQGPYARDEKDARLLWNRGIE